MLQKEGDYSGEVIIQDKLYSVLRKIFSLKSCLKREAIIWEIAIIHGKYSILSCENFIWGSHPRNFRVLVSHFKKSKSDLWLSRLAEKNVSLAILHSLEITIDQTS